VRGRRKNEKTVSSEKHDLLMKHNTKSNTFFSPTRNIIHATRMDNKSIVWSIVLLNLRIRKHFLPHNLVFKRFKRREICNNVV